MNKAVKITLGVVTLLAIGGVAFYFIRKRTKKTIGKIYAIKDSGKGWLTIYVISNRENYLKKALKEYGSSSSGASIGDIIGAALDEDNQKNKKKLDNEKK